MKKPSLTISVHYALLLVIAVLMFQPFVKQPVFLADSFNKLHQTESLLRSHFRSLALVYPGRSVDGDWSMTPFSSFVALGEEHVSAFPVAYSFLSALLLKLWGNPAVLYAVSGVLFWFTLLLAHRLFRLRMFTLYALALATPLASQYALFGDLAFSMTFLVAGSGLLYRGYDRTLLLSGALFALALFFRMESGLLFGSVLLMLLWLRFRGDSPLSDAGVIRFVLGFGVVLILFLAMNQILYGHMLGARYLFNQDAILRSPVERLADSFVLLVGGRMRVGFFGYVPWALMVGLFLAFDAVGRGRGEGEEGRKRPLVLAGGASFLYLFFSVVLAPNDSNIDWGSRYLTPSLLFLLPVLDRYAPGTSRAAGSHWKSRLLALGGLWSLLVTLVLFSLLRVPLKQQGRVGEELRDVEAGVHVFETRQHAQHLGPALIGMTAFVPVTPEDLDRIVKSMKSGETLAYYAPQEGKGMNLPAELGERRDRFLAYLERHMTLREKRELKYDRIWLFVRP